MDRRLSWFDLGARPAVFPALFLALGACLSPELPDAPGLFLIPGFLATCASLLLAPRPGAHAGLLLGCLLCGIGLSTLAASTAVPARLADGGEARLEGRLEDVLRLPDGTVRIDLAASHAPDDEPSGVRFRARLYARGRVPRLHPGQRIQVVARLKPLEPPLNPGQADFRSRQLRRGLLYGGGFDPSGLVVLSPPSAPSLWMERARTDLANSTRALAPSPEAAALYLTLAAGLRADLGDDLEERFSASGLAHVLSVSGIHVALLAVVLLRILRWVAVRVFPLARRFDARRIAAPSAIPFVWAYVAFTGNQMPAIRSAVMASAVLLGMAVWRRADGMNALALAAIALVALDPPSVGDLSTQLSFLAVASLVIVAPALRDAVPFEPPDPREKGWRRWAGRLAESCVGTLCASVAVVASSAPLIAATFHRLSLAGLVSNVVCLPLCGVLTGLAAGGAAVHVISPELAVPFILCGTWASAVLLGAVDLFAAVPGAAFPVPSFGAWAGSAFLIGLFGFALARGRARWIGLAVPASILMLVVPRALPGSGLRVTFLSVGHGDAIVMSSGGHHAIVDGGGAPGGSDTGKRYVLPFLREVGIGEFELAVLSHPHPDHALGLISTLEAVPTRRLWIPPDDLDGELGLRVIAAAGSAEVEEVEVGHAPLRLGEAEVEVLGPPRERVLLEGVNDRSVVLRVRHGEVTFLLTGDIERAAEEGFDFDGGPVTVLKAPHHGSRTSSTQGFVDRVRPKHVVFCVGRKSRFQFPNEEVVDRYLAVGARCHRTDLGGAITFESDGREVRVETFLPEPGQADGPHVAGGEAHPQYSADDPGDD